MVAAMQFEVTDIYSLSSPLPLPVPLPIPRPIPLPIPRPRDLGGASPIPLPSLSHPSPIPLPSLSHPSPIPLPSLSHPSPIPLPSLSLHLSPCTSLPAPPPLPLLIRLLILPTYCPHLPLLLFVGPSPFQPWQQLQAFSASSEEAAAVRARMVVGEGGAGSGAQKQARVKKEESAMEVDGALEGEGGKLDGERKGLAGGGVGVGQEEGVDMDGGAGEEAAGGVADVPFTLPQYVLPTVQVYFDAAYIQALVGSCLSHSSAAAAEIRGISGLSKSYLDSLPLERRLLALLSRAKTHIFQFGRLMNLLPAGTQEQQVLALLQHKALLVQGCWVAPSSMRCPVGPTCVLRDLLLLLFTKHRVIRQEHVSHLKVATSINGIYFLPTLNDPEVDPFREVVIALLRAKGAGGVGLKRTEIVEATRIALKAQVPAATYQRVLKELCVTNGAAWVLKPGDGSTV
ncbi:unnamed protein product [Closterium sp. Yama58-4]|nr:unnamed protein product [Closterium sp. Yama58-4]